MPLPLILDVGLTQIEEYNKKLETKQHDAHDHHSHHEHDHEHHHHHHGHHSHHLENDGFVSVSFVSDRPFDVHKFEKFLTQQMSNNVFRAKGILWFSDSPLRHIFQLSGSRYDLQDDVWLSSPKTQLVFIGRHLDTDEILQQLNQCLVS